MESPGKLTAGACFNHPFFMENMEMNLIKPLDDCQGRTVNIPEGMFNWIAEKAIQSVFFFIERYLGF